MPFQFTFSLPSLNPWARAADAPTPPAPVPAPPHPPIPALAGSARSIHAGASAPSLRGTGGKRGWMPAPPRMPEAVVQLSGDAASGYLQASELGQTRAREEEGEDPDMPAAKRRRTVGSAVVDMLSYALRRAGGAPSTPLNAEAEGGTHTRSDSQETRSAVGEPPPYDDLDYPHPHPHPHGGYDAHAGTGTGKRRPPSLSSEPRRRRPRLQLDHPAGAGRGRRVGGKQRTLTPSASFNPFRPAGSPRAITFAHRAAEGGEMVAGSVDSELDVHISRMDHTLQALLAEGARALGQEVVLPQDENEVDPNGFEQDVEEWEDD
ncbi:hypothetical protein CALCODRAFT_557757 [Calocera cornea HHB12733]|uniref:Uncharacterized protein n=1 Tax=Calocera cornea HHB12733 TaxID=1353952 RepID=A0A165DK35_9BASI|nr:hypothetical protein CALCODRAFT_557757 [Calocera cornea HHB12733]